MKEKSEGPVDGKTGILEISLVGKKPDGNPEWQGTYDGKNHFAPH
jgi:hypothetical protein